MTADEVAQRLGAPVVRRTATGVMVQCRAHHDDSASLSLDVRDDRVLIHCFALCQPEDILRSFGKTWADLRASNNGHRRIVRSYSYTDVAFNLIHQTVRFEPKDFSQRRPCPGCNALALNNTDGCTGCQSVTAAGQARNGHGWIWTLSGITPVLYRLPLIYASSPDEWIFLVEGEKDADELYQKFGLITTTVPMGAGKWRPEYSAHLIGRKVALLPDNDEPGRTGAHSIAQSLVKLAACVKIIELPGLPDKGDISDWIAAGHTVDELRAFVDLAEPYAPMLDVNDFISAADIMSMTMPKMRCAIEGLFPVGFTLLAGRPKAGKSWLALLAALCVATGGDFLDLPTEQGDVLYIALEDSLLRLQDRLRVLLGEGAPPSNLWFRLAWPIFDDTGLNILRAWLAEHPSTRMVIVDTYIKVRPTRGRSADSYAEDSSFGAKIADFARRYQISFVFLHHQNKSGSEEWTDTISGTHGLTGAADTLLVLERDREKKDNKLLARGRDVADQEMDLEFHDGLWKPLELEGAAGWLLNYLKHNGQTIVRDIYSAAKAAGFTQNQIHRAKNVKLKDRVGGDRIDKTDRKSPYYWELVLPPIDMNHGKASYTPDAFEEAMV